MFCEHVGLFRLSSAEVRVHTPRTVPLLLSEPARQSGKKKNEKTQLRSTTVSTPRNLLMAAIKSISPYSWNHLDTSLTHSTCHQLLVLPRITLPDTPLLSSVFSLPSAALIQDSRCQALPPRDNLSLSRTISVALMYRSLFYNFCPIFASLGLSSGLRRHLVGYLRQVTTIR